MKLITPLFTAFTLLAVCSFRAQVFLPIAATGYTLDAVAENTTALANTGGAIDGSDYVLYSAAYGALYSNSNGLPNSGLISSGTRTYQLQSYSAGNMLHVLPAQTGSISVSTPGAYAGISLLGFSTEGAATFDVVFTYTDNTTQTFTNQSFPDWFATGGTIVGSGYDRCNRTAGTPALVTGNPKIFALDYGFNCINRSKALASISIINTSLGTSRVCLMAISGTGAPTYSTNTAPVTCQGGTNGSAGVLNSGGMPPFTYTWNTTPVQTSSLASNLGVGVYSYSVQDNGGCVVSGTVAVSQSLSPQPNLTVSSTAYTVCSGTTFTLGVFGAATYTWANGSNSTIYAPPVISANTQTSVTFTVSGITSVNCLRTGSVNVLINPLPAAAFSSTIPAQCKTNLPFALAPFSSPAGGVFTGPGVSTGSFIPNNPGLGTFTITYTRTDANNCSNSATIAISVASLAVPSMTQVGQKCSNGPVVQMSVSISGGTFSGTGVSGNGSFNPSLAGAGSHPIIYSTTNGACTTTAGITILVNAAPTASIVNPKTFFCRNQNAVFLTGAPGGGSFSGSGITTSGAFSPSLAGVSNTHVIVYTYTDLNGCSDTASVRITVSTCAGIDNNSQMTGAFGIWPNPNQGSFEIISSSALQVELSNTIGQVIAVLQLQEGKNKVELSLAAGVYYVRAANSVKTQRLVITN
jgi:hypothetical protein